MQKSVKDFDSSDWQVINLDTKLPIPYVQWADDEKNEYICYKKNQDDTDFIYDEEKQEIMRFRIKQNIKLVKRSFK